MGMAAKKMKEVAQVGAFDRPDEIRTFSKGKVELVNIAGTMVGRATLEPGWRWSTCVQP